MGYRNQEPLVEEENKTMSFDFAKFCHDYNVDTAPEGHKHTTPGWVNVPCPFCTGNPGWHLGFEIAKDRFKCWRCGSHRPYEVICALISCSMAEAASIHKRYAGRPLHRSDLRIRKKVLRDIKWPSNCGPMNEAHKAYLRGRDFNPLELEETWGLRGTGPLGDHKFRIIAPVYYQNTFVSYQGRDITDKSKLKYKACEKENESRDHQDCLYGLEKARGPCVVVVEGIADVWRLGPGAVATFGIEFSYEQVQLLQRFERQYILYDPEPQAQKQAERLAHGLSVMTSESHTFVMDLERNDPAELTQSAADKLMKTLVGRE